MVMMMMMPIVKPTGVCSENA